MAAISYDKYNANVHRTGSSLSAVFIYANGLTFILRNVPLTHKLGSRLEDVHSEWEIRSDQVPR